MPATELLERLGEDELLVVDCRDVRDGWPTISVKIPGALRISLEELPLAAHALPDDELIVLYGSGDDAADARRAWRILMRANRRAVCLRGGMAAWIAAGFPTESDGFGLDDLVRL